METLVKTMKLNTNRRKWSSASSMGLLLLCGLAHAQSSVTIYGTLDSGLLFANKTAGAAGQNTGRTIAMNDSGYLPSQFGFTGTEDLGGGLKAKFTLESGLDIANGGLSNSNGNLFGRQAWVGLDGGFGEIKLGQQYSPFFLALFDSDSRSFADFGSGLVLFADNVAVTGGFNSNAVSYTSPKLAGFTGSAMLALGGQAGNFQAGRQYSFSLEYQGPGLMVNAAIYDGNSGGTVQTPVPSTLAFEGRTVGASYSFGSVTVKAAFVNYHVAGSFDDNVYSGGVNWYVLPQLCLNSGVYVTSDRGDTKNHSLMVSTGLEYFLSHSTSLYAQIGAVNNHGAMSTGIDMSLLKGVSGTTFGGNVGITHSF
jgi:predicted porin